MSEHVKVLRELREICRAAIEAGDWKIDGACDPDPVLRRADAAIASLSAPAEAQPVGMGPIARSLLPPTSPPSAPVDSEKLGSLARRCKEEAERRAVESGDFFDRTGSLLMAAHRELSALAQQPAARLETAAALCEEAAQVLRAVGCSGVVLPEEWRWPLLDELEGTAATIRGQAQQPAAEDPPTFAVDRALAERFARVWCKETTTTRFEDLPEAGKTRCVDDFFLVLYLVFVRQEESA